MMKIQQDTETLISRDATPLHVKDSSNSHAVLHYPHYNGGLFVTTGSAF